MLIGYARVSTNEQNLDLQQDALKKAGVSVKNIFTDKITGTKEERAGLAAVLSHLREGDTLVVWRLDRLGRSLKHLIETVTALHSTGVARVEACGSCGNHLHRIGRAGALLATGQPTSDQYSLHGAP
jgi:DNA invertase Pin-like site-specific DNA recombinase